MSKTLLKVVFILAAIFALTFILIKTFNLLRVEDIRSWFEELKDMPISYTTILVVGLLFSDLFIAIPTLTVTILSGYFLGPVIGGFAALGGMTAAGVGGFWICRYRGKILLNLILKDPIEREKLRTDFERHGLAMILVSRSIPILPEVTACLAGLSGMKFKKFLFAWWLNTIPYAFIASFAGANSSLSNPTPALLTAGMMTIVLWISAAYLRRHTKINK